MQTQKSIYLLIYLILFKTPDVKDKEPIKMVCCSISNCGNSSTTCNYTNKRITFHRFPQDPDIKDKWLNATAKRNWFPTNYSRICSVHFKDEDFQSTTKRRTLNKSAIPTVNIWSLTTGNSADKPQSTSATCEPGDSDTQRNKKLRREIQENHLTMAKQRLKIKSLQCKARRYLKQILRLQNLVKNLRGQTIYYMCYEREV